MKSEVKGTATSKRLENIVLNVPGVLRDAVHGLHLDVLYVEKLKYHTLSRTRANATSFTPTRNVWPPLRRFSKKKSQILNGISRKVL
jgi:hypothetical protein